ncbi:MFS transporter permease [Pseudobowmanella zhangzhouensis]|uniref:MFS transporter permease n=1 Tax=Pseudobowmanella zhangzhouensis TaxID=1537679 RepID=UPI003617BF25
MTEQQQPRRTFIQLLLISVASKLADLLMSAKTTLPWLLQTIAAPTWMVGLLVPIRESGSLIPQWWIGRFSAGIERRILLWRGGMLTQASAVLAMAAAGWWLPPVFAGWCVLLLLAMMSVGRAVCSLSMKDIQGALIEKGRRGKLVGWASSAVSALSVLTAVMLMLGQQSFAHLLLVALLAVSGGMFALSAMLSAGLSMQYRSDEDAASPSLWVTVKSHDALQSLIVSRVLMLHSALVAPYFISLNQGDAFSLPWFIVASAVASFLSSAVWGALADRSARLTLLIAGLLAVSACTGFYLMREWGDVAAVSGFFVLSVAHAGIRTGRKTYLLDIAEGQTRTQFVAAANTLVGFALICCGLIYAGLHDVLQENVLWVMATFIGAGVLYTRGMPDEK